MLKINWFCAFLWVGISTAAVASETPKNIIMVVGDGMGPVYTSAYRFYADDPKTAKIEQTVFDRHLTGMVSTFPAPVSGYITDSAASATALSSGVKSYNNAIAVDTDKQPVETVLQYAKKKGMRTGVAVTSQINHATPASYAAHNESRRNYDAIADDYFDNRINDAFVLDVMLGGGTRYFIRDDRNLVEEFRQEGYTYVDSLDALDKLKGGNKLLGLFGETGMPWALDTPMESRLRLLTKKAVERLENDNGFFLLVEGSQVDWAGHANDVASAMAEMHDLAKTVEWLEAYVEKNPDTLVVMTADHSTGGMSIAANGDYIWTPTWLHNMTMSPMAAAMMLQEAKDKVWALEAALGFTLNDEEKSQLTTLASAEEPDYTSFIKSLLDARTNTGWTTSGHTGVDVQLFAFGKGAEHFSGHIDNVDIAAKLFKLLGRQ